MNMGLPMLSLLVSNYQVMRYRKTSLGELPWGNFPVITEIQGNYPELPRGNRTLRGLRTGNL